jgi:nucleoside-diphosphate-sugar epimerase
VALDVNVMGVKHMCQLAKKCPNLEVILHVSTGGVIISSCLINLALVLLEVSEERRRDL